MSVKSSFNYQTLKLQSLSAAFSSTPTRIIFSDNISYQINVATTDSIGTFVVEASNDYIFDAVANKVVSQGNWNQLVLGSTSGPNPTVNAANTIISIALTQVPFDYIRLTYTPGTAGTGVCDAFITCKRLGG